MSEVLNYVDVDKHFDFVHRNKLEHIHTINTVLLIFHITLYTNIIAKSSLKSHITIMVLTHKADITTLYQKIYLGKASIWRVDS